MQCLKMKVESLLKSHDVNQVPEQPDSSSPIESLNHGNQLMLQPSEISALMTGIGNMLINLKKKLCEIILAWNMRYQRENGFLSSRRINWLFVSCTAYNVPVVGVLETSTLRPGLGLVQSVSLLFKLF